jgi:hypothetical protein
MAGGLIQLIAVGSQNTYINTNPKITFFKTSFEKYSNFSMETKELYFDNGAGFDRFTSCKIKREFGDLLSHLTLKIDLPDLGDPNFSWANAIGHVIIDYVELEIQGQKIDKHYGEWLEIWTELTQPLEKKSGYNEMIGKYDNFNLNNNHEMSLLVPMNFSFCRNMGSALPLVCLFYSEIQINIKFRSFNECWVASLDSQGSPPVDIITFKASFLGEFIWLDLRERLKFATENHFYLYEYVQSNIDNSYSKSNNPINLSFDLNNLVKSLYWVVQRSDVIIQQDINENSPDPYKFRNGNDWFNYSVYRSRKTPMFETIDNASIYFNGMLRMDEQDGKYFRLYQNHYYSTKSPSNFIYTYSMALKPDELHPTGTANMSRLKHLNFKLIRKRANRQFTEESPEYNLKVYALSYNFLIVSNGMASVLFDN